MAFFERIGQLFLLSMIKGGTYFAMCRYKLLKKDTLKRHIKVHEVKRCEECGKWFSGTKEFRSHRQFHKRNKKVADDIDIQNIDVFELIKVDVVDVIKILLTFHTSG